MVAATGIGSGLDIEGLVTSLVNAEGVPAQNRLVQQETKLTSELSAFGTLQGVLAGLQSSVNTLTQQSTFDQRSATSSNSAAVSVSASADAAASNYQLQIDQLAQAQSLASGSFASLTDTVGEGTLTFRFGTTDYTPAVDPTPASYNGFTLNADRASASITIDSSNNSLQGLSDAINDADIGVAAAIVNDGTGFRLLLSSDQTGAANSLEVQVDDTGDTIDTDDAGLSRLAFNASADNLEQTVAGQSAAFSINGLALTSESNSVANVIDGVSITLRDTTDTAATLSISENTSAVRSAIEGFVAAYNGFVTTANNLTAFNAETGASAPLQGDFTARSVINQVRSALTASADGFNGPFSTLAELGVTTQANGTLTINDSTLNAALADNFDSVAGVFAQVGSIADSSISFEGATASTVVGSYAVNITQLATQGNLAGTAITDPGVSAVVLNGTNNSFSLTVNGTASANISLTEGTYNSAEALAAEIQSRINGDSALSEAGINVSVAFNASFELQITSTSYGSESSVAVNSNTTTALGLAGAAATTGVDVAGTIGGLAATGIGQLLSAASGSNAEGVRLTVSGGALGSRGDIEVSNGIGIALNGLLGGLTQTNGLLDLRTDGLQSGVDRISDDRDALDRRLEALEARYRRQFNALDTLLANLQSTGSFITQQLANIPIPGANSNN
ncbi:MAG: flagellar hook-associated protein 2 [Glaciecola sp.]|jgi:flagellar hook-associated protein 2|uniref:flagellar filament capping protein FliD n=1 Tax=Congregibacter sp. TaxID=2744308 RepID=UPI0039E3AA2B